MLTPCKKNAYSILLSIYSPAQDTSKFDKLVHKFDQFAPSPLDNNRIFYNLIFTLLEPRIPHTSHHTSLENILNYSYIKLNIYELPWLAVGFMFKYFLCLNTGASLGLKNVNIYILVGQNIFFAQKCLLCIQDYFFHF